MFFFFCVLLKLFLGNVYTRRIGITKTCCFLFVLIVPEGTFFFFLSFFRSFFFIFFSFLLFNWTELKDKHKGIDRQANNDFDNVDIHARCPYFDHFKWSFLCNFCDSILTLEVTFQKSL